MASLAPNPTTASSIITRLEKRELVTREPHPEFGGGVLVAITEAGSEVLGNLFGEVERKVVSWFGGHFSDEEMSVIATLLERI